MIKFQIPNTKYQIANIKYQIPNTKYRIQGTVRLVLAICDLPFAIRRLPFAICHLRFAIRHLRFAICSFVICYLLFAICYSPPVAAQNPPPDPRFGAVEAFWDADSAAEAGVAWERILFYWSELQPNGPEDWNGYHVQDVWLEWASNQGREVVGLLKHTPAWATDGPVGCGVPRGLDLPVDDPGNTWATFVRRTVGMYAGRVNRWIIWNEPEIDPETYGHEWCGSMDEYYQLLKVAYLAAHQANPEVVIHLAGTTFWHDRDFLQRFLGHVVQDPTAPEHNYYFDVVATHIYFQTETVPYIINETRAALNMYGLTKPIWVNETNASPDSDPEWPLVRPRWRVSLEEQAGFLLQSFALALSAGAERIAVYKWVDAGLPPGGEPFGVLRPDNSRRPAFDAYRLITTHYAGTISASEDRSPLHIVVTLERGALRTRVLWARTSSAATISVPASAPTARLIDQTGAEQIIEPVDGWHTFTLPGARCADPLDGCIIGGTTYLLVEETGNAPPPEDEESATPVPAESETEAGQLVPTEPSTTTVPTEPPASEPLPTDTPPSTETPAETPIITPSPTTTPLPIPTAVETATPTPPLPTPPPPTGTGVPAGPTAPPDTSTARASTPPTWSLLVGVAVATIFIAVIGTLVRYRGGYA
jgi:hypothetical protein